MVRIRVETNVLGVFALKGNNVVEKVRFPDNIEKIADSLAKVEDSACEEELALIEKLAKTGTKKIAVKNPSRFYGLLRNLNLNVVEDDEPPNPVLIGENLGISKEKILELISQVSIELTKRKTKVLERDQLVIQAINSLDDLDESFNRLMERLREWYSLHFPELNYLVVKHEMYAELVKEFGLRKSFLGEGIEKRIKEASESSIGCEFSEKDMDAVKKISEPALCMLETRKKIEKYLEGIMKEVAPNMNALTGPLLGARLIALAGGLRRLALLPAGTIQILGAEDAFFRFLKTGKKPPKHGVVFQQPDIRSAPKNIRGKLARTFAAKVAIAAKIDAFKGSFVGEKLKGDFKKRVDALRKVKE